MLKFNRKIFVSVLIAVGVIMSNAGLSSAEPVQDYSIAIEKDDGNAELYLNRGIAYEDLGEYSKALQDYNQSIQLAKNNYKAYWHRGVLYEKMHKPYSAMQDYDEVIKQSPDYHSVYSSRGELYAQLGEFQKAVDDCKKGIELAPSDSGAYCSLAEVYNEMSDYDQCVKAYDKAIELASWQDVASIKELRTQAVQEKYNRLKKLYANYAKTETGYWLKAVAYLKLGKYADAETYSRKAISIDKQFGYAYESLGEALYHLEKNDDAIKAFTSGIAYCKKQSKNTNVLYSMYRCRGGLYMKENKLAMALRDLNISIRLSPEFNQGAYYLRGEVYRHMGEYEKALDDYKKAISGDGYSTLSTQAYYAIEEITLFRR